MKARDYPGSHLDPWLAAALEEVEALMRERGSKYGPGNIAEWGDLGVLVRLSDKLARLRHSRERDFADETARDAWLDVIGYGLIGLAWADGNWPGSERGPVDPTDPCDLRVPSFERVLDVNADESTEKPLT